MLINGIIEIPRKISLLRFAGVFLSLLVVSCVSSSPLDELAQEFGQRLNLGNYPLVFEDTILDDQIVEEIIKDLEILMGSRKFTRDDSYSERNITWPYRGVHRAVPAALDFAPDQPGRLGSLGSTLLALDESESLKQTIGLILEIGQGEVLFVSKGLSDFYKDQIAMRNENLEAFSKLDTFITYLNGLNSAPLGSSEFLQLFYIPAGADRFREGLEALSGSEVDSFVDNLSGEYRYSGLLSVITINQFDRIDSAEIPSDMQDALRARVKFESQNPEIPADYFELIYQSGNWSIVAAPF